MELLIYDLATASNNNPFDTSSDNNNSRYSRSGGSSGRYSRSGGGSSGKGRKIIRRVKIGGENSVSGNPL